MQHIEGAVTGPIVESADAQKVTQTIQCWCGGCTNQTLHDCTCALAATERQKVAAALKAGTTPDALIAAYVNEHGPQVRIVPEKRGLDLIGWAVPFVAALASLLALTLVLFAWRRRAGPGAIPATAPHTAGPAAERAYRERLERELKEIE
jgi:cytochrome c-type biogenesis protein CcmH/NrfF